MTWIFVAIALIGVILNIRKKWQGFLFWLVSNSCWCVYNITIDEYAQAFMFAVFASLAVYGIYDWRRKE